MNYQITCICGNTFQVPDSDLSGPHPSVICPKCHQKLNPVIDRPPTASDPTPTANPTTETAAPAYARITASPTDTSTIDAAGEATKRCPFCGEVILAIAKKCKHCGEFLDRALPPNAPGLIPHAASAGMLPANSTTIPSTPTPPPDIPPVYALSVSQWDNFWKFLILLCLVAFTSAALVYFKRDYAVVGTMGAFVLAAFIGWFFYLNTRQSRCFIRPTRIDTEDGILSKELNSLELFRIIDMELKQGFIERMLGIGTIRLMTAESGGGAQSEGKGEPELTLYQIPKAREVYKYIQNQIPIAAKMRGAIYMEK